MRRSRCSCSVRAFAPPVLLAASWIVWLAACGPEGAAPESVRAVGQPLEAYCKAQVNGVGTIDVETDYLPHVVHCENGGAPYESLKAQAVSARTFLYYKLETAGSINDGTSDQVYSCGSEPTADQIKAVQETSGQFLSYKGDTICAFFVAGAKQSPPSCQGGTDDATNTEKYVTYNWGLSGDAIHQTTLGWVNTGNTRNRGCLSQWGSRCLANDGWVYADILHFYYGMDATLETATGSCVTPQNQPPTGNLDAADCTSVRGWAQDPDEPDKAVEVHVSFDAPFGDPSATTVVVSADQKRDDLCTAIGSCNHAFDVAIPAALRNGAAHAVHVEAVDTAGGGAVALAGSPGSITCTQDSSDGGADAAGDASVAGDATDDAGVIEDAGSEASTFTDGGKGAVWANSDDEGCTCAAAGRHRPVGRGLGLTWIVVSGIAIARMTRRAR